ncbi:DUF308 domain-containing protein, partial [Enterococcus sp. LJL99]
RKKVKKMNNTTKFFKSYRFLQVLTGILYLLMAVLAMRYTEENIVEAVQLIGVFALIKGFFNIMNRDRIAQRTHHKQTSAILLGVVDLIVGLILVVDISLDLPSLAMLFGIWFISDAVISFFLLDLAKRISMPYYYVSLVVDLLGGLIGLILLIANETTIISVPALISYYFLMFGFIKLIGGVINKHNLHTLEK